VHRHRRRHQEDTISTTRAQPIAAYLHTAKARDRYSPPGTLTTDAIVTDAGREYHGHDKMQE
jgi:hypothetical protein